MLAASLCVCGSVFHLPGPSVLCLTVPLDGRLTDPEILEFRYPLVIEDFGIRQGSGGDGKFKGGNGISRKIKFTEEMTVSMLANHRKVPPPPSFLALPR